ncbi:hypothetical protein [Algoriphagus antarcticus]|nr:hypothetical protein [Algoriphagus antarcticus]
MKEESDNSTELVSWQKKNIDERLSDYYNDPDNVGDFDKTTEDIDRDL